MNKKGISFFLLLLAVCLLLASPMPAFAAGKDDTQTKAQSLYEELLSYKLKAAGNSSVQEWISGQLSAEAGITAEWYVFALSQNGNYNFSAYQSALSHYLSKNTVYAATTRQKYALAFIAAGSRDSYITSVMEDSIGQQGVMSWIYGLHLCNNGYTSSKITAEEIKQKLLSLQLSDGGWLVTGTAGNGDPDVTAMTLQALAPYYQKDAQVKNAIDRALLLLSERQLADGDFSDIRALPNCETTAQVITALSALGIDFEKDARFIKNGHTLLDGIRKYHLADGSFCHTIGGSANESASSQAFYALVAAIRMTKDQGSPYVFDHRNPPAQQPPQATKTPPVSAKPQQNTQTPAATKAEEQPLPLPSQNATSENISPSAALPMEPESSEIPDSEEAPVETEALSRVEPGKEHAGYKVWVSLGIIAIACGITVFLVLAKKRGRKDLIFIWIIAAVAVLIVILTDFQSTESYYQTEPAETSNAIGTVMISIHCDAVLEHLDQLDPALRSEEWIPADGVILAETSVDLFENDSVYDVLERVSKRYKIPIDAQGDGAAFGNVYIQGIQHLYQFSCGELSGWMYYVNGEFSSESCSQYILQNDDSIEWVYTCDLGQDIERDVGEGAQN